MELQSWSYLMMLRIASSISCAPVFPPCSAASLFDQEHIILGSCFETEETSFPKFYTDTEIACFDNC